MVLLLSLFLTTAIICNYGVVFASDYANTFMIGSPIPSSGMQNDKHMTVVTGVVNNVGVICPPTHPRGLECDGPVSNASVTVYNVASRTIVNKTTTDQAGNYMLNLEPGEYTIEAQVGSLITSAPVSVNGQKSINANLTTDSGVR